MSQNSICLFFFISSFLFLAALADCPNACSGHGSCGKWDMCSCYRGFQGSDCSLKTCQFGFAFITTPQGDLNSDGDRADNTWKKLSQSIATFKINSDTITLSGPLTQPTQEMGATNDHRGELSQGDFIRVGNQIMEVTECKDSHATTVENTAGFTSGGLISGSSNG